MRILSILGADEMAEAAFKRDTDGWLFKAPPLRRLFGINRSYWVTDAQKDELKKMFVRTYGYSFLAAMLLVPVLLGFLKFTGGKFGWREILAAAAGAFIISCVTWGLYFRALRRLLPDNQASLETVTYADSQRAYIRAMPLWRGIAYTALSTILMAGAILALSTGDNPGINKLGVVLFGLCTIYFAAITFVKIAGRQEA